MKTLYFILLMLISNIFVSCNSDYHTWKDNYTIEKDFEFGEETQPKIRITTENIYIIPYYFTDIYGEKILGYKLYKEKKEIKLSNIYYHTDFENIVEMLNLFEDEYYQKYPPVKKPFDWSE